jgi:hypothetical protein
MAENCRVAFCHTGAKCYTRKLCHSPRLRPAPSYAYGATTLIRPSSRQIYCKVCADTEAIGRSATPGIELAEFWNVWSHR